MAPIIFIVIGLALIASFLVSIHDSSNIATMIGERLFLALDTVKGHNRIIFDKLQVQSCAEAAARARELGLL